MLPWSGQVELRAIGGGILGATDAVLVDIVDGVSVPEFVTFTLANHGLNAGGGVRGVLYEDIEWTWQQRRVGEKAFVDNGASKHRVYTVYRKPREPWSNTPNSVLNAWTDALDFACSISGGVGAPGDLDEITHAVAYLFNSGGGTCDAVNGSGSTTAARLMYDPDAHYTTPSVVSLGAFLDRWRGGAGYGPLVNCTDCAALFSTFANLLGANLWQCELAVGDINPVMPIGCGSWWLPDTGNVAAAGAYPGESLLFHEIAFKDDVTNTAIIWDLCYLVNGFADPSDPDAPNLTTRIIHYPWGIPFSGTAGTLDYREMLAYPGHETNTVPIATRKVRRTPV